MKPLLIGHRGAMGLYPENTLMSFRAALGYREVSMVELDVYCLPTGELVVIHDDKLDRTTDGTGYVMEKAFSYIRSLDAGKGERVPTLDEVLDLVDRKAQVNIELKGEHTAEAVAVVIRQRLAKGWKPGDFLVSSFNHIELARFKAGMPEIRIGVLLVGIPLGYAKYAADMGAYSINPSNEFIDQEFVDDAHRRGLNVYCWTLKDADEIRRMARLGVDGIFVNDPGMAMEALAALANR